MHRLALVLWIVSAPAAMAADEGGWVSLFNGRDLGGWVNVNCGPETWGVKDGVITCTGKPTGGLRTQRMYENFILELEWRHLKSGGNAGIFVWSSAIAGPGVPFLRSIEVQVLDNGFNVKGKNQWYTTHGDVFPIHGSSMKPMHRGNGSRCFPLEERSKDSPQWNHYRIVARDGSIRLSVNGKEVSGGDQCVWRKGYLGLESEGSPTEWRNIRIQELPGGSAGPEQTAPADEGWRPLYNGLDLRGWKADGEAGKQWSADDWQLVHRGGTAVLESESTAGDFELIVDCQPPKPKGGAAGGGAAAPADAPAVVLDGRRVGLPGKAGAWTRHVITVRGREASVKRGDGSVETIALPPAAAARRTIGLAGLVDGSARFANVYLR